jgi:hypothetical protein
MKRVIPILVSIALFVLLPSISEAGKVPAVNHPIITGDETVDAPVAFPPYPIPPQIDERDIVGDTVVIGTTWYESQSNGTVGRMLAKDESGYFHFAWMNGLDYSAINRHIYYNYIDPSGVQGWPGVGVQVDSSARAGYTTLDVDFGGVAFPTFHQTMISGYPYKIAIGTSNPPYSGWFSVHDAPLIPLIEEIVWPRIQIDRNGRIHVVASEAAYYWYTRHYYISAEYDSGTGTITFDSIWTYVDEYLTDAIDVATSDVSDRIAIGWTHGRDEGIPWVEPNEHNNDIYIQIDEDGINPWFVFPTNLTDFIPPNLSFLPDTVIANMDTLRAYTDLDLYFDQDDYLHAAFTTVGFFALNEETFVNASTIWHWTEQYPDEFRMVRDAFDPENIIDCGAYNVRAQKPCLGQDPSTGYLYCMFQEYDVDSTHLSAAGWPSGDIYVSVSTDGGLNWSVGTNVTNTITPQNAPAGECLSELTPSMAKVVDDVCHIMYVLDRDAGFVIQNEGSWTLNDVIYHKVSVDSIPAIPLVPQWPEPGSYPFYVIGIPPFIPRIELTALDTTVFPSTGGVLEYNIMVENPWSMMFTEDIWCDVIWYPDGYYGPVLGPVYSFTMPLYWSGNRDRELIIPENAPATTYFLNAYIGDYDPIYPEIIAEDHLEFIKTGDADGTGEWTFMSAGESFADISGDQSDLSIKPESIHLYQNSPNPFNPATTLSFTLPEAAHVELTVFDLQGRVIAGLVNGLREAGVHEVTFDASQLASGLYFYRIEAGGFSSVKKMILMK